MKLTFKERIQALRNTIDYKIEAAKLDFVGSVTRLMTHENISNTELADRIDTSKPYITKLLRGDANVSIATMVKVAEALDAQLCIHLAPKHASIKWMEVYTTEISRPNKKTPNIFSSAAACVPGYKQLRAGHYKVKNLDTESTDDARPLSA